MKNQSSNKECQSSYRIQFYKKSIVMSFAIKIYIGWTYSSLTEYIKRSKRRKGQETPDSIVEVYVLTRLAILCVLLFFFYPSGLPFVLSGLPFVLSCYTLWDIFGVTFDDIVASPIKNVDNKGPFISIGNPTRWLFISIIQFITVIFAFAILFLNYGFQFKVGGILDATTALYVSAMVFTTQGSGDFTPLCNTGKILICIEIIYFLFLSAVKLPIAVSAIRVKTRDKPKYNITGCLDSQVDLGQDGY
ncbi:MAG: hypothetical protein AB1424_07475 [Thermodesulfobacteriota bacterium]